MGFITRRKFVACLVILLVVLSGWLYLWQARLLRSLSAPHDFSEFDNVRGVPQLIVPNLIHFILFDQPRLDFVSFICILSAFYNHKPSRLILHTNVKTSLLNSTSDSHFINGPASRNESDGTESSATDYKNYFALLSEALGSHLVIRHLAKPTHVFGQVLSSVRHASDVARIKVLMQSGGIYLDNDVFLVRPLNRFRHFEMTVGWPINQSMGSQVLVAHKDARFLRMWLDSYREYRASLWYYNAGEGPTKSILHSNPHLVHRVTDEFGVQNLAEKLFKGIWSGWTSLYTVHLLASHSYLTNVTVTGFNEKNVTACRCTYSVMANSVLDRLAEDFRDIRKSS